MFTIYERLNNHGVLVDNTGGSWRERRGGMCRFGWSRSVFERTENGVRIRLLSEAVEVESSQHDGNCRASEETEDLLDGSCDEARIIEGIQVSSSGQRDASRPSPDDGSGRFERQSATAATVTFDTSSEEAMNSSIQAMGEELGDALTHPMGLILLGYGIQRAQVQGLERNDPDDAEAFISPAGM